MPMTQAPKISPNPGAVPDLNFMEQTLVRVPSAFDVGLNGR